MFIPIVIPGRVAGEAGRARTLSFHCHSGAHESGEAAEV